jgi:exodeoxyribonuclease-5
MTPIVLTPHQTEAVQFLSDHLHDGDPIVALRGLAGTGKTSLIPALIEVLEATGLPVTLGAPTHRAAMVLRKKGLAQADTVHSHALTPYFTGDYTKALRWLGGSCQCKVEDLANAHVAVDGVPWLVAERLAVTGQSPQVVQTRARMHEPKRALESIGIYGRSHFAGFGPKCGEGVLIIDEASMVGSDMLALCQEAFPQLCLIGDPGQLPPVKDAAALASVPGFDLTEIHRQAKDSAIIQLAYAAREGQPFWQHIPSRVGEVEEYLAVEAAAFLTSPLIVWRNKVRLACTQAIRSALGYPPDAPTVGEPLVCRSSDPRARADGFYNNALFRIVDVSPLNPRLVTVQADGQDDAETHEVLVHMEDTDGPNIDPEAILFRYGYCLTAHTAQGGEWPTVYISKPDLMAQAKRKHEDAADEHALRQWAYTAITRAKTTLGFLRKHDFTATTSAAPQVWAMPPPQEGSQMPRMQQEPKVTPPSAPFLSNTPADAPDDIVDPTVPVGVLNLPDEGLVQGHQDGSTSPLPPAVPPSVAGLPENLLPLAHGFCQYVQGLLGTQLEEAAIRMTKSVDLTMSGMAQYTKGVLTANEHASYQLSDALLKLGEQGLKLVETPYTLQVQVRNPAGVPIIITVRKASAAELLDELTRLEGWLEKQGYTGQEVMV